MALAWWFACLIKILIIIVFLLVSVAFFTLAERKVLGTVQPKKDPNVAGLYGLLPPLADGLKLFVKEFVLPSSANTLLFLFAPILTFIVSLVGWGVVPFSKYSILAEINIGLFYIFAVSALGIYGLRRSVSLIATQNLQLFEFLYVVSALTGILISVYFVASIEWVSPWAATPTMEEPVAFTRRYAYAKKIPESTDWFAPYALFFSSMLCFWKHQGIHRAMDAADPTFFKEVAAKLSEIWHMQVSPETAEGVLRCFEPSLGHYFLGYAALTCLALWYEKRVLGGSKVSGAETLAKPETSLGDCVMWQPLPEPTVFDWLYLNTQNLIDLFGFVSWWLAVFILFAYCRQTFRLAHGP